MNLVSSMIFLYALESLSVDIRPPVTAPVPDTTAALRTAPSCSRSYHPCNPITKLPRPSHPLTLPEFFELDWVNAHGARLELLFLRRGRAQNGRGSPPGSLTMDHKRKRLSSEQHVAFPAGEWKRVMKEACIPVRVLSHPPTLSY